MTQIAELNFVNGVSHKESEQMTSRAVASP